MRNLYVREDWMIVVIRALLHETNANLESQPFWMLARHLREHRLDVWCSETSCLIQAELPN